jgi:hypothetical protein
LEVDTEEEMEVDSEQEMEEDKGMEMEVDTNGTGSTLRRGNRNRQRRRKCK